MNKIRAGLLQQTLYQIYSSMHLYSSTWSAVLKIFIVIWALEAAVVSLWLRMTVIYSGPPPLNIVPVKHKYCGMLHFFQAIAVATWWRFFRHTAPKYYDRNSSTVHRYICPSSMISEIKEEWARKLQIMLWNKSFGQYDGQASLSQLEIRTTELSKIFTGDSPIRW
jgi:hypothetical protein